jgi:hypothetical protein
MDARLHLPDEEDFRLSSDGAIHRDEIHPASKQDVELYIRTYSTMLRSSGEVKIKALVQVHLNADSALHVNARSKIPDMSAFLYCVQRLPAAIMHVNRVLLGQSAEVFRKHGFDVEGWQAISAPGRRRRWFFDGKETLAVYVNSASDVDDFIPTLTGFQIEWNKFNDLLCTDANTRDLLSAIGSTTPALFEEVEKVLQQRLHVTHDDWERLQEVWDEKLWDNLLLMLDGEKGFTVRMLGGSYIEYAKATQQWWSPVNRLLESHDLTDRPIYFVSSNTHALVNLLGGSILRARPEIEAYLSRSTDPELKSEYEKYRHGDVRSSLENLLYYASRRFYATEEGRKFLKSRQAEEEERGVHFIPSREGMPIDVQVFELDKLDTADFDSRIRLEGIEKLRSSRAIILNIDYPLGLAAYYIFVQLAESLENIRGVYVLGKAATLNGRIGDVMVSDSVYDEHTLNTYWLDNCFTADQVTPFLIYGSVLDNQRAVAVKGTYLQNRPYLDFYYRENYTVVEMEAGPYLNALYEYTHPTRHPTNEHINFTRLPFDLGFLHYASDTPYTRGQNLGAIRLAYLGMDSAYATSVAIVRRILSRELRRLPESAPEPTTEHEPTPTPKPRKEKKERLEPRVVA